jgi:hypothetical protein
MADAIQADISEWEKFADKLEKSDKLLDKHMRNAMDGSLFFLEELITSGMGLPYGKNPSHGKNIGTLQDSFAIDVYGETFGLTGIVATPLLYGLPVELGRSPGKGPPQDAIKLWVVRKLKLTGKKADQAAFLIARAIGRHGTKGVFMVKKAYDRARGGNEIAAVWADEMEKFLKELAK